MYVAPRWIDRNLTRAEMIVSVCAIALFIGTFMHYGLIVYSNAERSMLNATVTNINTALRHRVLLSRIENHGRVAMDFGNLNPMTDMQAEPLFPATEETRELAVAAFVYSVIDEPPNYVGEKDGPPDGALARGIWYYDTRNHELVYTVVNTEYFRTDLPGQKRVRFRLEVAYDDRNHNGKFDPLVDVFESVTLRSPDTFEWKT